MPDLNLNKKLDSLNKEIKNIGEVAKKTTKEFHKNYESKIPPVLGKYGKQIEFAAEMIPGVGAINDARKGDWKGALLSTGLDIGSVALGTATVGSGFVAVKAGTTGAKVVTKEVAKEGVKKLAKEGLETEVKKVATESIKDGSKEVARKTFEKNSKKYVINRKPSEQIIKNSKKYIDSVLESSSNKVDEIINTSKETLINGVDKVRGIEKVEYGKHYKTGTDGIKKLKESKRYTTKEGYGYLTDNIERISKVDVKNLEFGEGVRNKYAQSKIAKQGESTDGGHLVANMFKGSGNIDNLVPMSSKLNRAGGDWYQMEKEWANALLNGKKVSFNIHVKYKGDLKVPDSFVVKYFIDGKKVVKHFKN
ncbi:DNA/RNA non-specific endonuclease [Streptococcus uberis]|uniref:DNA/RNA non-specific endonuclease n=1 Tax=Streptococcus uberis TaxID=1349 RepID=UPI0038D3BE68